MPRTKEITYRIMSAIKSKNTRPEKMFEAALRKSKIKFKKHYPIEGKPDFVILDKKVAVFIDGDFWHGNNWRVRGFKSRAHELKTYKKFWSNKILNNVKRDKKVNVYLKKMGWRVIRLWEHELKTNPIRLFEKFKKRLKQRHG